MDARQGLGKIFLASPLNPRDLAPLVKKQEVVKWDTEDGGLSATLDLRIGNIILQSSPLPEPDPKYMVQAIGEAIKKEGENLLNFDESMTQWQNRILSLRKWRPQDRWPDVSLNTLLQTNAEWLSPYLIDVRKPAQLKKLDLIKILRQQFDYEKQHRLDKLAPTHIKVPSGSRVRLNYRADGLAPVLAVRIQEIFGMKSTPTVNEGRTTILLHLLSPGYKPVQITDDLENFWASTYFEVRKELKGRYPKHVWPDEPENEPAIRGVKPRKK